MNYKVIKFFNQIYSASKWFFPVNSHPEPTVQWAVTAQLTGELWMTFHRSISEGFLLVTKIESKELESHFRWKTIYTTSPQVASFWCCWDGATTDHQPANQPASTLPGTDAAKTPQCNSRASLKVNLFFNLEEHKLCAIISSSRKKGWHFWEMSLAAEETAWSVEVTSRLGFRSLLMLVVMTKCAGNSQSPVMREQQQDVKIIHRTWPDWRILS